MAIENIPALVRQLYKIVEELEYYFPGRKFTPDGHLVGSIGEVIAAAKYGVELLPASAEGHDAKAPDGRLVQIKATQGTRVALRSEPEHLIVLFIERNGETRELYNGPGRYVWEQCGKMQKNGQRPISLSKINKLQLHVTEIERVSPRN
ncbi:MAG: DUF6998 domain-containing protein [Planctomycetota bacterium]|jgi:hypothetical protein